MSKGEAIMVTGATGNIGRHVVSGLSATNRQVRALVRDPSSAALPDGVEAVHGDLTDPDSLKPALDGVRSVFLLWPFLTAEGASAVVDAIAQHAEHVVYLSATAVRDDRPPEENGVWGQIEHLIGRSGLQWTFLRAGGLATNTLGWAEQIRTEGVVRWPYGAAGRSLIHETDVAAVAVRALTEPTHAGAKYVLTGPATITQADQVRTIGEVIGRPVRWEEADPEVARQQMLMIFDDPDFAAGSLAYWAALVDTPEPVTSTVEEIIGVPARTFRQWALDHAADFGTPSAEAVAEIYVGAFRRYDLDAAWAVLSPDMVRVAPLESGGEPVEVRGLDAITENSNRLNADLEIHGVDIQGPFLNGDRFAVRFAFDETHVPTVERKTTAKMSLYTVAGGQITREEVYYFDAPI